MTLEERYAHCNKLYTHKAEIPTYNIFNNNLEDLVGISDDMAYFYWRVFHDGSIIFKEDLVLQEPIMQSGHIMRTNLRRHNFMELAYIVKGNFRQFIIDRVYEFNEGDFVLLHMDSLHYELVKDSDCFVVFLDMSPEFFKQVFEEAIHLSTLEEYMKTNLLTQGRNKQFIVFTPTKIELELSNLVEYVLEELEMKRAGWRKVIEGYMIRMIYMLLNSYKDRRMQFTESKDNMMFDKIITYISKNYSTITIEDLVREFHYHEAYYSRLLKKYTNLTFSQYTQKVRMNKAKELLRNTEESINSIVKRVGYTNKGYFYRIFKEKEYMTPQEYRDYFIQYKFSGY